MGLSKGLRGARDRRAKSQAELASAVEGVASRTTWQVSMRVSDKERMREWARQDGVTMAELLRQMIAREERRRRRAKGR